MYHRPRNDVEYSKERLEKILKRRRLGLNPYSVSDDRLLEIANMAGWGNGYDITEMVIMRFTRLRETHDYREFDGIYVKIGDSNQEIFIGLGSMIKGMPAIDSNRIERAWLGKRVLRKAEDIQELPGSMVFVSHGIRCAGISGSYKLAYRMHKLTGNKTRDSKVIRKAMCDAKIEMLNRLMEYPESPFHLDCKRGLFDYETPIQEAIQLYKTFYPQ